jgi:hypothetical protein
MHAKIDREGCIACGQSSTKDVGNERPLNAPARCFAMV